MRLGLLAVSCLVLGVRYVGAQGCPPPANVPVGNCQPKAGVAVNFSGDTGPVRIRKSIYRLTPAEVTELRLAFRRLRNLPAIDPRTWMAQAKVHCWYCAGDASTAPDVHGTWAFMPWHRNYLYVLEKTLGSLVNNPSFALPYWDWNTADTPACTGHLGVPPPYLGATNNALFDCYRDVSATSQMSVNSVGPARVNQILNLNNTFSLFFGGPTSAAALWPGPHGYVHLWVGSSQNINLVKQDMGVLETAARDPLFWAHHANIDRLWDVWISKYGTPAYPADFLTQSWTFWDQGQKLARLDGRDAARRATRLKYRYAPPCGAVTPTPAPTGLQAADEPDDDVVAMTPAPQTFRSARKPAARKFTIGPDTGTHVVINLEDVTVPADQAAILRVYVNKPGATAATEAEDDRLVQELFIVPSRTPGTAHGAHQHAFHLKIPLPEALAAEVEAAQGEIPVTIVPVGSAEGGVLRAAPAAVDVRMKKPYITVE